MRFVLVDELLALEPGRRVRSRVTFPPDLELFADHFPRRPIVPGSLITEAMGQSAGWLIVATLEFQGWPVLTAIDQTKFYRFVEPGEALEVEAEIRASHPHSYEVLARARVGDQRAARARLLFRTDALTLAGPDAEALEHWARQVFARLGGEALSGIANGSGGTPS